MARKLLGRRKATMKASDIGPAPRIAAIMMSRKNPATRDSAVNPPTDRRRPIKFPSPARLRGWRRFGGRPLPQGERGIFFCESSGVIARIVWWFAIALGSRAFLVPDA